MIKTHSNKMGYTKPCSHLIPSSTIHSHQLVSTPTHFHPLYSFLTLFHSFAALFHAHVWLTPSHFKPTSANVQPLSPIYSLYANTLTQSNPSPTIPTLAYFPCISRAYMLYVHMCSCAFVFHVPICICNSFLWNLLPMSLYLRAFVCVNTPGLFIYAAFLKTYL